MISDRIADDKLMILIAELPGLEAARKAIQDRIDEIHRRISREHVKSALPTGQDTPRTQPPLDPTVLGRDSLGRIIRKRKLSPEVVEKKRQLMNRIREVRLKRLQGIRETQKREAGDQTGTSTKRPTGS